ncbi:MAG: ATP-binding protein, partial [Defluviitaleaceae bacterium]|nr:ATP-binding protein [Defluviitaleaceae bacterium]
MKTHGSDKKTMRFIRRAQALYFSITTVLVAAILLVGLQVSRSSADDAAYRMARQYAVEASANFQIYMNPHMRLMEQIAHAAPIGRWLANEHNEDFKSSAFNAILRTAETFPDAYMMFTVYESRAAYDFHTHFESHDEFVSWGTLAGGEASQWFFDTLGAESPFILNIQRSRPDEDGNWQLYIWTNHRIYYQNEIAGVITIGTPFTAIYDSIFGEFEYVNKRGYILDRSGNVRLDSAGMVETDVDGLPVFHPAPEAETNPALVEGLAAHLRMLDGGIFPLGTFTPEAVRLDGSDDFNYAAISPIVGTDWSVMVLSSRATGITMRYFILVVTSIIFLVASAAGVSRLVRRLVLIPLQEMEREKEADRLEREVKEAEYEAEEINRIFLEASPFVINIWDDSYNLLSTTPQAIKMFGCSSEAQYIANFFELSPAIQPDGSLSSETILNFIKQAFDEGYVRFEWLHRTLNGRPMPVEITLARFLRKGKSFVAAYIVDLRPVKVAMDERIRMMFDATPLVIEFWKKDFTPIDCNKTALEYFGLSSTEAYALVMGDYFENTHPGTAVFRENLTQAFKHGTAHFEFTDYKLSGEVATLDIYAVSMKIGGENVVVTYSRDITNEREIERERTETNAYKDALLEASPLFIDVWDEDFNLIDCNDRVCDLLGVPTKEEFLENLAEKYNPAFQPCGTPSVDLYTEKFKIGLEQGFVKYDWTHLDVNGNEVLVEVTYVRVVRDGKRVLVGYNYDMREIKEAQAERYRIEIAEESNRAKTAFLARMSHEIRTPISAVLGISEIELQSPDISPHVEESFAKINDSAQMLTSMVNDILDLSKIEAGRLDLFDEEYETAYLISDAANMHLIHLGEKDIVFRMFVDPCLPTHLIGDEMRIGQILNNLLSNAFKYTDSGEVSLALQYGDDESLIVSVCDTGFGMTKEQLDSLFLDYTRFHEHRLIGGTGLGMSIVYNLVQLMNAEIDIESEPNVGTKIVVIIPQKRASRDILGEEAANRLEKFERTERDAKKFKFTPELMPYGKVLVVDDLEANLYVTRGLLAFYELEVDTCISGIEAIEKIKSGKSYDLILMDYMMPEMNGTEAMHKIRELGFEKPIVVLTANVMIGMSEKFMQDGFDDIISKPINTTRLNTILIRHIRDKQPRGLLLTAAADVASAKSADIDSFQSNRSLMDKLCEIFVKRHKGAPTEIRAAIRAGNTDFANLQSHSLKSAAGLIHEHALAKAAEACEYALNAGELPT